MNQVRNSVWKEAGLKPANYCCRECLTLRLKRPLRSRDFTRCLLNYEAGLKPQPQRRGGARSL
jgi:hypothetical protein